MNERHLAAWHEAGLAVVMQGQSTLVSVALGDRHGEGLTRRRGKPGDEPFIAYAGPWAEARYRWRDRLLEDEDGLTFGDHVHGALLAQPDDAAIVRRAGAKARASGLPPELVRQLDWRTDVVWQMRLQRGWPAITAVSVALLEGRCNSHEAVEASIDGCRQ